MSNIEIPFNDEEMSEEEWLKFISVSSAFAFLSDSVEDIYSIEDGKPFDLQP
jgi:hypothetical protein